jgi:hypothetical protein
LEAFSRAVARVACFTAVPDARGSVRRHLAVQTAAKTHSFSELTLLSVCLGEAVSVALLSVRFEEGVGPSLLPVIALIAKIPQHPNAATHKGMASIRRQVPHDDDLPLPLRL